ncbi:MAG: UDP-N-acetylglucosamine--N-acetylmuramyl-(pentapeptide) pyrophosphoryl-undecaprenol N-acetylglucosamine transferase [Oscillospiraceae bacterium]|nr:UDP-N-acetylglucosamine--N-acetylmuramyl-(pentapeptide) pyrophosphoryl-undecaprenol N-acetylglucosamine transferase [Oscillospiraceae bacterium]
MKYIIACGGTAGHINPGIAVAEQLKILDPEAQFLFVGALGKMEMDLVPRDGYDIKGIRVTNISRSLSLKGIRHNIESIKNVLNGLKEAKNIIKDFCPDAVIGTGGYVCYPVLKTAAKMNIPTAVHESNAYPGLTTKMLSKDVDLMMVGFEESCQHYPNSKHVVVTGTPVRNNFGVQTREEAKKALGISSEKPLVLSVWGSLGSGHMNAILSKMLPLTDANRVALIHATGKGYYENFCKAAAENGFAEQPDLQVMPYIYDMATVMTAADLVMCRAGASTLAELTFLGKPALIVPSPNVTNNHQEKNARVLETAGGAKVLLEGEFDENSLLSEIYRMTEEPETAEMMSQAMKKLAVSDSAVKIAELVYQLALKNKE